MYWKIVYLLSAVLIFIQPAHAYIDPGTGSMLFSAVLCSMAAVFFLFNSLLMKLKQLLSADKKLSLKKHKFTVYSEGNQYYKVFKPVLDEFERRCIPVMYYTSAENDYILNEKYNYIKSEFIGKGNKAYFKLTFLNADVCLMTTPQLDVLQLKRSKNTGHYCHIMHAIGFSMSYRLFGLDYYDSVLCDAEYQAEQIREIERKRNLKPKILPITGCTYMDYNEQHLPESRRHEKFTVLLAPSWGILSLLHKSGSMLIDKLKSADFKVIIRPHPQSMTADKKIIETLRKKFPDSENIEWDFTEDNLLSMSVSDILISDFSSVMFDWAFLFKKPFLYTDVKFNEGMYDFSDLDDSVPWKMKAAEQIGRKIQSDDIDNIVNIINEAGQDTDLSRKIEAACSYVWQHQGEAAQRAVDFLVKTQQEIEKEC